MDLEEREGGTQKESGERGKKKGIIKISCLEWMELMEDKMGRTEDGGKGKVWPRFNLFSVYFFLKMCRWQRANKYHEQTIVGKFYTTLFIS